MTSGVHRLIAPNSHLDPTSAQYQADGYSTSITNLGHVWLSTDMVFSDGWDQELGTVTDGVADGCTIALTITV